MPKKYRRTIHACFTGYIVQAIVNLFIPLLFITIQTQYNIPLSQITMLITFNFTLQLITDFGSVFFVDKIGYKASMLTAHLFSAFGLIALTVLPELFSNPFAGFMTAAAFYAVGGGLLEVVVKSYCGSVSE